MDEVTRTKMQYTTLSKAALDQERRIVEVLGDNPITPELCARAMREANWLPHTCEVRERLHATDRSIIKQLLSKQGQLRIGGCWWEHGSYRSFVNLLNEWMKHKSRKSSTKYYAANKAKINADKRAARREKRIAKTFEELREIAATRGGNNGKQ